MPIIITNEFQRVGPVGTKILYGCTFLCRFPLEITERRRRKAKLISGSHQKELLWAKIKLPLLLIPASIFAQFCFLWTPSTSLSPSHLLHFCTFAGLLRVFVLPMISTGRKTTLIELQRRSVSSHVAAPFPDSRRIPNAGKSTLHQWNWIVRLTASVSLSPPETITRHGQLWKCGAIGCDFRHYSAEIAESSSTFFFFMTLRHWYHKSSSIFKIRHIQTFWQEGDQEFSFNRMSGLNFNVSSILPDMASDRSQNFSSWKIELIVAGMQERC